MPAMAHPGDHAEVPVHKIAGHLASSPFHLVLAAFGLAALAAIVTRMSRVKRVKARDNGQIG